MELKSKPSTSENPPTIDTKEFIKVVESRRSVRKYTDEKIPESVVRECLRLALLAPTSSNLQSWEFHWVRTADIKSKLAAACLGQPAATTAAELIVCVARTNTWPKVNQLMRDELAKNPNSPKSAIAYYDKLVPMVYSVGFLNILGLLKWIVFTTMGLFRPVPRGVFSYSALREWAVKTTALACENLMLSFRAFGYDTCPMEGFDEVRVRKLLQLPRGSHVVMVISAGKRAADGIYSERIRFDQKMFVKEV